MQEWFNWRSWKDRVSKGTVGSNPTPSAFASLKRGYGVTNSASRHTRKRAYNALRLQLKMQRWLLYWLYRYLEDRLEKHKKGYVPATANRLPVKLEFYFVAHDKYKAFDFEKYLKSGSGRAFIKKHF